MCMCSLIFYLIATQIGVNIAWSYRDTIKKSFDPLFNTTVIFNTTDKSWHGHPDPMNCPEHIVRRSLAFYYYTKPEVESEAHNTIYVERPGEKFKK